MFFDTLGLKFEMFNYIRNYEYIYDLNINKYSSN